MATAQDKQRADKLFSDVYNESYTTVYRFVSIRLKEDRASIDDCVQEAYIVLYKKYLAGEQIANPIGFLLKTANNYILKTYSNIEKQAKTVNIDDVKNLPDKGVSIDDRLTFEQYSKQISAALGEIDAEIFALRFIEEQKLTDIAQTMNMSLSSVTTRISRMKPKIKQILEKMLSN